MQHAALVVGNASTSASRVFVPVKSENVSYQVSTRSVKIRHVAIDGSIYMLDDVSGSTCSLLRVNGDTGIPYYPSATLSGDSVTITNEPLTNPDSYKVASSTVDVDVITVNETLYVLGETGNSGESRYRTLPTSTEGNHTRIYGDITTPPKGSSTGEILGIAIKGDGDVKTMYTFDETPSEITSISGEKVRWLDKKPLTEVPNHTLKYGLGPSVWTVLPTTVKLDEPFIKQ